MSALILLLWFLLMFAMVGAAMVLVICAYACVHHWRYANPKTKHRGGGV